MIDRAVIALVESPATLEVFEQLREELVDELGAMRQPSDADRIVAVARQIQALTDVWEALLSRAQKAKGKQP